MAATAQFPDLHHKMSKKIAQLTKVIFAINTKNDDHDYELQRVSACYESEIEQILKDATKRINDFRLTLSESSESKKEFEVALSKLQEQHESEKKAAFAQFDAFKQKVTADVAARDKENEAAVADLVRQLTAAKEELARRMTAFSDSKGEAAKSESSIRAKFEAELRTVVQEHNDRYNRMMAQQLQLREEERMQIEKSFEDKLNAARKEGAEAERVKWEETLRAEQLKRKAMIDALQQQLQDQAAEHKKALQLSSSDLDSRLSDLSRSHSDAERVWEQAKTELTTRCRQLQEDLEAERALSALRATRLTNAELQVADLERKLAETAAQGAELEKTVRSLKDSLLAMERSSGQSQSEMQGMLESSLKESEMLRRSLAEVTERDLPEAWRARDELARNLAQAESSLTEVQSQLSAKEREAAAATQELSELQKQLSTKGEIGRSMADSLRSAQSEIRQLQEQLVQAEDKMSRERNRLETDLERVRREKESLKEAHAAEIEGLQRSSEKALGEMERSYKTKLQSSEETVRALTGELELSRSKLRASEEAHGSSARDSTAEIERLRKEKQELLKEMAEAVRRAQDDAARRLAEAERTWKSAKAAGDDELSKTRLSLEKQIKALEGEKSALLGDVQAAVLAGEKKVQEAEKRWQVRLADAEADHSRSTLAESNRAKSLQETIQQQLQQIGEMRTVLAALQAQLEQGRLDRESDSQASVEEALRVQAQHAAELEVLRAQHADALERMRTEKEEALVRARREMELAVGAETQRMESRSQALLADQQEGARLHQEKRERQLLEEKKAALEEAVADIRGQMDVKARKVAEEHAAKVRQMETRFEEELSGMRNAANKEREDAQRQIRGLEQDVQARKQMIEKQATELAQLQEGLRREQSSHAATRKDAKAEAEEMGQRHASEMAASVREYEQKLERQMLEFERRSEAQDRKNSQLEQRIMDLELRYENRESRLEDVERIRRLESEVREQTAIAQRAVENMNRFKMELQNREESYNKTFGRSPQVGVMGMPGGGGSTHSKSNNNYNNSASSTTLSSSSSSSTGRLPPLGSAGGGSSSANSSRPSSGSRNSRGST